MACHHDCQLPNLARLCATNSCPLPFAIPNKSLELVWSFSCLSPSFLFPSASFTLRIRLLLRLPPTPVLLMYP
ncbi:hypothetical protein Mp_1g20060 [Marchantia polymorpha subsp. ruderalis]|uniref:Uncharacterized protein n=2 Tax=Marchantia polymorpha TaxID=3197 RepID=A0AAF6AS47_MARPO|nr:hypothetical protein MARPO_0001s0343 [Marchantia polymorpha]BBM99267.1 hypothetical protein Mp_1g20060 [Marchantia polymorpha subsp. ruderalis]|eukprot:PTQ50349.1 hypothetical protein MARPO_0001s0343 [Marchantia polymorpha]